MKVIEFLGMPRSGKTTAIEVMESYLKQNGKRVRVIHEGARICPLDKSDRYNYNSWSFHNTINRILEARLENYDFILIDRGVIDHLAFLKAINNNFEEKFIHTFEYFKGFLDLQDLEIYFYVDSLEAIKREHKHKPFVGRVFNIDFLTDLSNSYETTIKSLENSDKEIMKINGNSDLEGNLQIILDLLKKLIDDKNACEMKKHDLH